jgi:hypothetical protein
VEKGGGGTALNIFSIFYTHHRIPDKHMMTIKFDTITNNYEVIHVIKTVMKYYLKKIDTRFHQRLPNMVHVYLLSSLHDVIWFMNIFMSKITHDFWLCGGGKYIEIT